MGAFNSYFGLWFGQGALLVDKQNVLINAQEGTTKALRQWRMKSSKEIKSRTIKAYVKEAMALVDGGKEIKPASKGAVVVPLELKRVLAKNKKAAAKFKAFTSGLQREFTEHISSAKRATTKQSRIEKIMPMILDGVGLNDKYRNR